jgi:hypothetical protein
VSEKLHVHIHHQPRDGGYDCLGQGDVGPGQAIGGELAGGQFFAGLAKDGTLIITFEDTVHPEEIVIGEMVTPEDES